MILCEVNIIIKQAKYIFAVSETKSHPFLALLHLLYRTRYHLKSGGIVRKGYDIHKLAPCQWEYGMGVDLDYKRPIAF